MGGRGTSRKSGGKGMGRGKGDVRERWRKGGRQGELEAGDFAKSVQRGKSGKGRVNKVCGAHDEF